MRKVLAKFWTVNSPTGPGQARFPCKEMALQVACSLAKLHVDQEFYVMQSISVSYVRLRPVETMDYTL